MSKTISVSDAAMLLRAADNILILTHRYPDGDTLGSGFALCRALLSLGKKARVTCADEIQARYSYMLEDIDIPEFEPEFICAVDVADPELLGSLADACASRVDLCIDHHLSNTGYAFATYLRPDYAAAAAMIYELINELGVDIDAAMASCIYTGLATDTGCFKYANTTSRTLRMAADMLDRGADSALINRLMFDTKSRRRLELERRAIGGMRFYLDGRCAIMAISLDMITESGADESDLEGLASIPRQVEGVWAGVTMRELEDGTFKVSIRSGNGVDASAVCGLLGGGGHVNAAGCTVDGPEQAAADKILSALTAFISVRGGA